MGEEHRGASFEHALLFVEPTFKRIAIPGLADLTAPWQICGIFSAKSWRVRFSRECSPPRIRREKIPSCRNENYAAFSLPHDS
jgi:hypothetical protein